MSEYDQRREFMKNLNRLIQASGRDQVEIAATIGVAQQTFNSWCRGVAIPRMGKIQLLADYFGVTKSQLLGEDDAQYYLNPETAMVAQQIYESKEMSALFSAARDAKPEDLMIAYDLLLALKKRERHEEE